MCYSNPQSNTQKSLCELLLQMSSPVVNKCWHFAFWEFDSWDESITTLFRMTQLWRATLVLAVGVSRVSTTPRDFVPFFGQQVPQDQGHVQHVLQVHHIHHAHYVHHVHEAHHVHYVHPVLQQVQQDREQRSLVNTFPFNSVDEQLPERETRQVRQNFLIVLIIKCGRFDKICWLCW